MKDEPTPLAHGDVITFGGSPKVLPGHRRAPGQSFLAAFQYRVVCPTRGQRALELLLGSERPCHNSAEPGALDIASPPCDKNAAAAPVYEERTPERTKARREERTPERRKAQREEEPQQVQAQGSGSPEHRGGQGDEPQQEQAGGVPEPDIEEPRQGQEEAHNEAPQQEQAGGVPEPEVEEPRQDQEEPPKALDAVPEQEQKQEQASGAPEPLVAASVAAAAAEAPPVPSIPAAVGRALAVASQRSSGGGITAGAVRGSHVDLYDEGGAGVDGPDDEAVAPPVAPPVADNAADISAGSHGMVDAEEADAGGGSNADDTEAEAGPEPGSEPELDEDAAEGPCIVLSDDTEDEEDGMQREDVGRLAGGDVRAPAAVDEDVTEMERAPESHQQPVQQQQEQQQEEQQQQQEDKQDQQEVDGEEQEAEEDEGGDAEMPAPRRDEAAAAVDALTSAAPPSLLVAPPSGAAGSPLAGDKRKRQHSDDGDLSADFLREEEERKRLQRMPIPAHAAALADVVHTPAAAAATVRSPSQAGDRLATPAAAASPPPAHLAPPSLRCALCDQIPVPGLQQALAPEPEASKPWLWSDALVYKAPGVPVAAPRRQTLRVLQCGHCACTLCVLAAIESLLVSPSHGGPPGTAISCLLCLAAAAGGEVPAPLFTRASLASLTPAVAQVASEIACGGGSSLHQTALPRSPLHLLPTPLAATAPAAAPLLPSFSEALSIALACRLTLPCHALEEVVHQLQLQQQAHSPAPALLPPPPSSAADAAVAAAVAASATPAPPVGRSLPASHGTRPVQRPQDPLPIAGEPVASGAALTPGSVAPAARAAGGLCLKCGQAGHVVRNCPKKASGAGHQKPRGVGTFVGECFKCGLPGHRAAECTEGGALGGPGGLAAAVSPPPRLPA